MGQLNIHMNPEFEKTLKRFMRARGLKTKSEAIRIAVEEGLAATMRKARVTPFAEWVALGTRAPTNPEPRFASDRELWE